jgi:hypothetical protein
MMRFLFVGLCVACGFASIGRSAQPQPIVPSDKTVMRAAGLPPTGLHGEVLIVKELAAPGQWRCTVYFSTLEVVRLPWVGWAPVPWPQVRQVFIEPPKQKA